MKSAAGKLEIEMAANLSRLQADMAQATDESAPSVFESVNVLRVRPGDVLVFRFPQHLTGPGRKHVAAMLDEVFPAHESLILEGGQDIAVLRPEPGILARIWGRLFSKEATQ